MHMRESDHEHGPPVARVKFVLEDPHGLTDTDQAAWEVTGSEGESILELALEAGINIEHACGGVCACSTCHVFLESGKNEVTEADEDEDDRVEEAPGLQANSRLACQCILEAQPEGAPLTHIQIRVPSWNRNAVKEVPH